jgi:hypothetical protein
MRVLSLSLHRKKLKRKSLNNRFILISQIPSLALVLRRPFKISNKAKSWQRQIISIIWCTLTNLQSKYRRHLNCAPWRMESLTGLLLLIMNTQKIRNFHSKELVFWKMEFLIRLLLLAYKEMDKGVNMLVW